MKKYLLLLAVMFFPVVANAASANIELKASPANANTGKTITVTTTVSSNTPIGYYEYNLDYDHSKLELTDGNAYTVERANEEVKSFKKEFKFKVKSSNATKVSVRSYAVSSYRSDDGMSVTVKPVMINSSGTIDSDQSDNNYLSNLEVEGYKIEPSFDKNTTDYILKIEDDISEIKVKATPDNDGASVIGDGKHQLKTGDNRIEITVTSVSGKDKTYTIKVTLSEKNPIKVKVNGKEYIVVKHIDSKDEYKGYKVKKIKINDKEVEALYNDKTELTLVLLKDENGKTMLYIYDDENDSYKPYNVLKSGDLSVIPIEAMEKLDNYTVYTEVINDVEVDCYKIASYSNFCALYGMNAEDGKKDWYVYDLKYDTIQRYNADVDDFYNEKLDSTKTLIYVLSATTLLFGITTIVFAVKSNKKRK